MRKLSRALRHPWPRRLPTPSQTVERLLSFTRVRVARTLPTSRLDRATRMALVARIPLRKARSCSFLVLFLSPFWRPDRTDSTTSNRSRTMTNDDTVSASSGASTTVTNGCRWTPRAMPSAGWAPRRSRWRCRGPGFAGLPRRPVPLDERRDRVMSKQCPPRTRDDVWAHLVLQIVQPRVEVDSVQALQIERRSRPLTLSFRPGQTSATPLSPNS